MVPTATDVRKLREMTGAGMMKCKEALVETKGDMQEAIDFLRKKGLAAAQKKQSRIASEGVVRAVVEGNKGIVVEINCETDFVSKGSDFQTFSDNVTDTILKKNPLDITALREMIESQLNEFVLKCGEKVDVRRFELVETTGCLGYYNHGSKIGVLVESVQGGDSIMLKDVAMHVAAMSPKFIDADSIDDDFKNKEAEIYTAQLKEEGKPEKIIGNIVQGKLKKLAKEVCLLEQAYLKDPDKTVKQFLGDVQIKRFVKFNLGEGIEKKEDNLADEVARMTGKQ